MMLMSQMGEDQLFFTTVASKCIVDEVCVLRMQ